jgi:hypothetical protein
VNAVENKAAILSKYSSPCPLKIANSTVFIFSSFLAIIRPIFLLKLIGQTYENSSFGYIIDNVSRLD